MVCKIWIVLWMCFRCVIFKCVVGILLSCVYLILLLWFSRMWYALLTSRRNQLLLSKHWSSQNIKRCWPYCMSWLGSKGNTITATRDQWVNVIWPFVYVCIGVSKNTLYTRLSIQDTLYKKASRMSDNLWHLQVWRQNSLRTSNNPFSISYCNICYQWPLLRR